MRSSQYLHAPSAEGHMWTASGIQRRLVQELGDEHNLQKPCKIARKERVKAQHGREAGLDHSSLRFVARKSREVD